MVARPVFTGLSGSSENVQRQRVRMFLSEWTNRNLQVMKDDSESAIGNTVCATIVVLVQSVVDIMTERSLSNSEKGQVGP